MPTQLLLDGKQMVRLRVMVADPYRELRKIIRNILMHNIGIDDVIEAKDGEDALAKLADVTCDLLILDASMRPLGGIELAHRIRNEEEKIDPFVPIIIISDNPEMKEVMLARDVGVTEYLAKPISAKILDLHLRTLIRCPRPFIQSDHFFGPDRRRHVSVDTVNEDRRVHDPVVVEETAR